MKAIDKLRILAVVWSVVTAGAAPAESDLGGPASRADVKSQTKAAVKSHDIPMGEESAREKPLMSSKTRAERKSETLAARRAGQLPAGGDADRSYLAQPPLHSDKTRAQRKAETLAAAKAGKLLPAGEVNVGGK